MKNFLSFCIVRSIILVICSTCILQTMHAQTLTPSGILEIEHQWMLGDDLPDDFNAAVFDEAGNPLMDILFIVTYLSDIPTEIGYSDGYYCTMAASTGTNYFLSSCVSMEEFQMTIPFAGLKVYITGQYDKAFTGFGYETGTDIPEGWLYFQGGDNEEVDIYLHDVKIKTDSKTLPAASLNDWMKGYVQGMASPIAIGPNSTSVNTNSAFTAHFHIRGENTLTGGATTYTERASDVINIILGNLLYLSAAPIAIRPVVDMNMSQLLYENIAAKLTFDDEWLAPTNTLPNNKIHTNGILNLPVEGDLGAPSIDLGNAKGMVEFNGGQYKFHTPRTNSIFYVSSMAICYRALKMFGMSTVGAGSSASAGSSQEVNGSSAIQDVVINDGTFSTFPAEVVIAHPGDTMPVDVVVRGWYYDYTDLRLPYNTKIYGGTFNNCEVYRCDGSGEQGVPPVSADGTPLCRKTISVLETDVRKDINNNLLPIEETAVANYIAETYGKSSLTPKLENGEYIIHPYLAEGCNPNPPVYKRNWVTILPQMGIKDRLTMGGDVNVSDKTLDGNPLQNSYLFYTRLNQHTIDSARISVAGMEVTVGAAIALGGPDEQFAEVMNAEPYTIQKGIYSMLSFTSNEWHMISLPYDVHNIYVMETTKTQRQPNESLEDFLKRQGRADGDLAQNIVTSLCPDIFSGKGSGVNMNLIDIATKQIKCPPFLLKHYDGTNAADAHYYLYEQVMQGDDDANIDAETPGGLDGEIAVGHGWWRLETTSDYSQKWQIVPTYDKGYKNFDNVDAPVIMQKGRIYSFYLPSGSDQYWDGKYLIFEGYGPQTIQGRSTKKQYLSYATLSDYIKEPDGYLSNEMIGLQGNVTFSNDTTDEYTFLPTRAVKNNGYWYGFEKSVTNDMIYYPGQVYAVMSKTNTENAMGISRMGIISRSEDITGTTPIVGDVLLRAYSQQGSIYLFSHADQQVQIVSVDGRVVYSGMLHDGSQERIAVPTGVYVVRSTGQAIKLMVD